jgi:arabinan endo-1,5-alpha-L-arabinosidase
LLVRAQSIEDDARMTVAPRRVFAVLLLLVSTIAVTPAAPALAAPTAPALAGRVADDPIAHDPTVIRQGHYYYIFITGSGLPMRRSADLLHWTGLGAVFPTVPAWVTEQLGTTPPDLWAPDISYFGGLYHLYYAASSFGTNNSVIGLATARTLDPASPASGWVDRGMVLRSGPADDFNAIDPELVLDGGGAWLAFGSFWDGIKMRRLDRATGLLSAGDPALYSLASRGGASIEGASITRHGGYWYLFVSLDYCCRGVDSDYRVVVGRSTSVTGPYTDRAGVEMLAGGGTEVLRGYNEFRGPGGGDVYGKLYVHHYYDRDDNGLPKLSVRPITWAGGWPSLGDPRSGSREIGHGPAYLRLVSRVDGSVIANPACGYEGADIRLAPPSAGDPCQEWRADERRGGSVSLDNRFSNKVAEVAACVDAEGARVAQWGWLDNDCQVYRFVPAAAGWSAIQSRLAGRVLQGAGCGGAGSAVQTATATGATCQQFRLQPVGDVLLADAAGRLAIDGCGAPVTHRPLRPGGCQLWRFEHVADGYYRVLNAATGRALGGHRHPLGDRHHDLAGGVPAGEVAERPDAVVHLVPGADRRGQGGDLGHAAECAVDVEDQLEPYVVAVDELRPRRRERDREEPAAGPDPFRRLREPVARQHQVEHRVDAVGVVAVGDRRGPETGDQPLVSAGRGRGDEHSRSRQQRQHGDADAASRADHQDALAGLRLDRRHQRVGGQSDGGQRRRGLDVQPRRAVGQERRVRFEDRVLRERAGGHARVLRAGHGVQGPRDRVPEDLITDRVRGDPGPDLGDRPGEVVAWHVGEVDVHLLAEVAADQPHVGGVERGRVDPGLDLPRAGPRHRQLAHLVALRRAVAPGDDRLHACLPRPKRTVRSR